VATIPLALRNARAIGDRTDGPLFLARDGRRLDRHGAGRIVRKTARSAGITKLVTPHTLRHAFITAELDAGVPLRDVQEAASHADPRTTMRYDRARGSLDRMLLTLSPRTSQAPPDSCEAELLCCLAAAAARQQLKIVIGPGSQPKNPSANRRYDRPGLCPA